MKKIKFSIGILFISTLFISCGGGGSSSTKEPSSSNKYDISLYSKKNDIKINETKKVIFDEYRKDNNILIHTSLGNFYINYTQINSNEYSETHVSNEVTDSTSTIDIQNNKLIETTGTANKITTEYNRYIQLNDTFYEKNDTGTKKYEKRTFTKYLNSFQVYEGYKTYDDVLEITYYEKNNLSNEIDIQKQYFSKNIGLIGVIDSDCLDNASNINDENTSCHIKRIIYTIKQD